MDLAQARFLGLPLIAVGGWLLVDSIFLRFAHEGQGTLAPVDPPRAVVRGGAFRFVRNPMYIAVVTIIVGEALLFRSWRLLLWAAALFAAFHLFVIGYEEPTLGRQFGESYEIYRRNVGRWLPRLRGGRQRGRSHP